MLDNNEQEMIPSFKELTRDGKIDTSATVDFYHLDCAWCCWNLEEA